MTENVIVAGKGLGPRIVLVLVGFLYFVSFILPVAQGPVAHMPPLSNDYLSGWGLFAWLASALFVMFPFGLVAWVWLANPVFWYACLLFAFHRWRAAAILGSIALAIGLIAPPLWTDMDLDSRYQASLAGLGLIVLLALASHSLASGRAAIAAACAPLYVEVVLLQCSLVPKASFLGYLVWLSSLALLAIYAWKYLADAGASAARVAHPSPTTNRAVAAFLWVAVACLGFWLHSATKGAPVPLFPLRSTAKSWQP
jgi:hypothetical protein